MRRAEKPGPGGSRHVFRKGFLVGVVEFVVLVGDRNGEIGDVGTELGDRRVPLRGVLQRDDDRILHDVRQIADLLDLEQLFAYLTPVRQLPGGKVDPERVHAQLDEGVIGKIRGLAQLFRFVEYVAELVREVLGDLGELGRHRLSWEVLGEGLVPRVVVGDLAAEVEVLGERSGVLHVERARVHRAVGGGPLRDDLLQGFLKRHARHLGTQVGRSVELSKVKARVSGGERLVRELAVRIVLLVEYVFALEVRYCVPHRNDPARGEGLAAPVVLHQHRGPDALGDVLLAAEHVGDALPEELAHRVVVVACALPAENAQRHPVEPAGRLDIALLERGASALLYVALRRNGLVLASGHPPLGEADESAELLVYCVYHGSVPFRVFQMQLLALYTLQSAKGYNLITLCRTALLFN